MTFDEKRLSCLERRMRFLKIRTDNGTNRNLSYDCQEMSALNWAIRVIRRYVLTSESYRFDSQQHINSRRYENGR